jgi:hypothetical protein
MPQRNRLWESSRTPSAPVLGKYLPNGSYGSIPEGVAASNTGPTRHLSNM